jgi:hypothetical protein
MLPLLGITAAGAGIVVLVARVLRLAPGVRSWRTGAVLAAAHTAVLLALMLAAPLYIAAFDDSPYGDVYGPYLLAPGIHIYYPARLLFGPPVFGWLLGFMQPFPASVLCVIIGPGLVGLLAGGLQWFVVGACWDRLAGGRGPNKLLHRPGHANDGSSSSGVKPA